VYQVSTPVKVVTFAIIFTLHIPISQSQKQSTYWSQIKMTDEVQAVPT